MMIMISSNLIFNFNNFCIVVSFVTKLLTLGTLLSKLVILGILTSVILALRAVVVAKLVILDI